MALGFYYESTPGSGVFDTLDTPNDGIGVRLASVGATVQAQIRASAGMQNAVEVTINPPDGVTISKSVFAIGEITDATPPVTLTWVSGDPRTTGGTTTPRLASVPEEAVSVPDTTAPVLSGTLVATAGDGQVTLSGLTATDNVGIAKWQYAQDGGEWGDIASSASGTMPSTVITGLENDIEYSFTVRALDAAGNPSAASAAATATPVAPVVPLFSDDFNRADSATVGNDWSDYLWLGPPTDYGIIANAVGLDSTAITNMPYFQCTHAVSEKQRAVVVKVAAIPRTAALWLGRRGTENGGTFTEGAYGYAMFRYNYPVSAVTGVFRLARYDNGTPVVLDEDATARAFAAGDTIAIVREGTDVVGYHNGVEILRATDTTYMTAADTEAYKVGMAMQCGNNQGNAGRFDDLVVWPADSYPAA